jgi:hypothetical protein
MRPLTALLVGAVVMTTGVASAQEWMEFVSASDGRTRHPRDDARHFIDRAAGDATTQKGGGAVPRLVTGHRNPPGRGGEPVAAWRRGWRPTRIAVRA